jgi:aminoglycoside phosphotransferase (APT) family kinase protein
MPCCGSSGGKAKKILGEPVTEAKEDTKFEQVVHKFDPQSKLLRTWELKGGVSARVTALETLRPDGHTQKMIVRQHGEVDLKHNPQVAADEFKLLHLLHSVGLATPAPYYLDQSGEIFSTPYLVIEYIEGKPEFAPSDLPDLLLQLATQLSRIHQVDGSQLDVSFLPQQANIYAQKLRARPANMDESLDEGPIRDALEAVWPFPQRNTSVLLHGDFWPGNILWRDGQLVAVIDWEDAALGDPLADVANSRLEILWAFGLDAMQSFTHQYQSMTTIDFTHLPYWDLCAALRRVAQIAQWGLDDTTERTMRERHRWFVTQAFEKLSIQ